MLMVGAVALGVWFLYQQKQKSEKMTALRRARRAAGVIRRSSQGAKRQEMYTAARIPLNRVAMDQFPVSRFNPPRIFSR